MNRSEWFFTVVKEVLERAKDPERGYANEKIIQKLEVSVDKAGISRWLPLPADVAVNVDAQERVHDGAKRPVLPCINHERIAEMEALSRKQSSRRSARGVGCRHGSALVPTASLPVSDHSARDLALSPVHTQLPRR